MADEDPIDAPQETTSDAGVPDEDMAETTSAEDEPEVGDEPADEGDEASEDEAESAEADEPSDDDEDEAWKNFQKKFDHIKNPRDRRAAMGKAWWEKNNFASRTHKEAEDLKVRLARLEATRDEPKDDRPTQPPPELAKIDQRIQVLYAKDKTFQEQQNRSLIELSEADKAVAVIEDRLKDADEYQKAILEQRLETAKIKKEATLNRWADLNEKREGLSLEMEQRLADRDWTAKFLQDKATRDQSERQTLEQFNADFPKHVDGLISSSADSLGAPKDPKIRQSLWRSVNKAMMVDLWQLGEKGLQQVNVPEMVKAHVKEYLQDRDLVSRSKFTSTSAAKLKVAGREAGKPARPVPAAQRPPVPPSLLTQGDTTPAMRRARELLTRRFGG